MKRYETHDPEMVRDILPRVLAVIRVQGKQPVVVVELPKPPTERSVA